jgi:hypothetical protein
VVVVEPFEAVEKTKPAEMLAIQGGAVGRCRYEAAGTLVRAVQNIRGHVPRRALKARDVMRARRISRRRQSALGRCWVMNLAT